MTKNLLALFHINNIVILVFKENILFIVKTSAKLFPVIYSPGYKIRIKFSIAKIALHTNNK